MNEALGLSTPVEPVVNPPIAEDETPPRCPSCHRRLVMLAMHWVKDEHGAPVRRQLWGCPRGHATAHRLHGRFSSLDLLESLND